MKPSPSKSMKTGAGKKRSREEAFGSIEGSTSPASPPRPNPNKEWKKIQTSSGPTGVHLFAPSPYFSSWWWNRGSAGVALIFHIGVLNDTWVTCLRGSTSNSVESTLHRQFTYLVEKCRAYSCPHKGFKH
jgi:hypothetical protein